MFPALGPGGQREVAPLVRRHGLGSLGEPRQQNVPDRNGVGVRKRKAVTLSALTKEDGVSGAVQAGRPKPEGPLKLRGQEGRPTENPGATRPSLEVSSCLSPSFLRRYIDPGTGWDKDFATSY